MDFITYDKIYIAQANKAISNGFTTVYSNTENAAYQQAIKIGNNNIKTQPYLYNPRYSSLKGLGAIFIIGERMSSGVIIGNYTFLTTKHSLQKKNGYYAKPSELRFYASLHDIKAEQGSVFAIKNYELIPNQDISIVHTYNRLTNFTQKASIASDKDIRSMKARTFVQSIGYPKAAFKPVFNSGYYLRFSPNYTTMSLKMDVKSGQSGSPIYNSKKQLVGIITYNYLEPSPFYSVRLNGGVPITNNIREYIKKYNY